MLIISKPAEKTPGRALVKTAALAPSLVISLTELVIDDNSSALSVLTD